MSEFELLHKYSAFPPGRFSTNGHVRTLTSGHVGGATWGGIRSEEEDSEARRSSLGACALPLLDRRTLCSWDEDEILFSEGKARQKRKDRFTTCYMGNATTFKVHAVRKRAHKEVLYGQRNHIQSTRGPLHTKKCREH